jgi:hypothetical protein
VQRAKVKSSSANRQKQGKSQQGKGNSSDPPERVISLVNPYQDAAKAAVDQN